MAAGETTYDVSIMNTQTGQTEIDSGLTDADLQWLSENYIDYTIINTYPQTNVTILDATSVADMQSKAPNVLIVPAGNDLDIAITVSAADLLTNGVTLSELAMNQGWGQQLTAAGLQINSVDTSIFSATIIYHCTTTLNVNVSSLILNNDYYVKDAGAAGTTELILGIIKALAIVGVIVTIGIVAIHISSTTLASEQVKAGLTEQLTKEGWTPAQIAAVMGQINTNNNPISDLSDIVKYIAIGGAVIFGLVVVSQIVKAIPKKSSQPQELSGAYE
jgi:hypothetical protein